MVSLAADSDVSLLAWIVGIVFTTLPLYLFYPALVAAAAPHIQSKEVHVGAGGAKDQPILLSLVIPAYNEELRLTIMLQEAYDYLTLKDCPALQTLIQASSNGLGPTIELILVDDGSQDQTTSVYQDFCNQSATFHEHVFIQFRLLRLHHNVGKGAAVQSGMLAARGEYRLMVDADGATAFGPGLQAVAAYAASHDFVLGSRADLTGTAAATINRSRLRKLLQTVFHLLVVSLVGTSEIQDTQCGFKLFRGSIVRMLFEHLHLRRWAFDTELLYRAAGVRLRLQEVTVPWHEVEGSKLNTGPLALARVAVGMLRDMLCVRLCYTLRIWNVPRRPKEYEKDQ